MKNYTLESTINLTALMTQHKHQTRQMLKGVCFQGMSFMNHQSKLKKAKKLIFLQKQLLILKIMAIVFDNKHAVFQILVKKNHL